MPPVEIFLETSSMPRHVQRPGHAVQQLIDLVKADLANVHASTITIREWKSQMQAGYQEGIDEMHSGVRKVLRQKAFNALSIADVLSKIADAHDATKSEADSIVESECDRLLRQLGVDEIPVDSRDCDIVFDRYFSGALPFAKPKHRNDIPDAFIFCAANNFAQTAQSLLVVCNDKRLRKGFDEIDKVKSFDGFKSLFESEQIQTAMSHLALFKAWTPEKKTLAVQFLECQPPLLVEAIDGFATDELPGLEFTDESIPADNNVATIDCVHDVRDLEIRWESVEDVGPGWVVVPFEFECDAELSLYIFRSDAFLMPEWIQVNIGDFENDYYFEASAYRAMRVFGTFSLRYSLRDLESDEELSPSEVEVENVRVELDELAEPHY